MMPHAPVLVTAHLGSPIAGDPPRLDGLLEATLCVYHSKAIPGYKITRATPPPPMGAIPISMTRERLGPWLIARCSDPILPAPRVETVEHVAKKIGVEHAGLLRESSRLVVSTTNSWTKSYRLPLRIRVVDRVRWFAVGNRREIRKALAHVTSIGKKISCGYGRVAAWEVERTNDDLSWYAPTPHGLLLMATLPSGDWLPKDLIGYRKDFGACCPPYWHPDRYAEIVVPC